MPYEWQSALAGKGIPTILSVCADTKACACAYKCRGLDILRHPLYQGGYVHQHCHHQQGSLVPWWRWGCQHTPPPTHTHTTIYPIIKPHTKHTVSSGCFDGICLQSKQSERGMEPETKIGRRRRDGQTHALLSASIENAILPCCSSALHTREHAPYSHSVRVTLMELIWETSAALPGRGIYWQGESQTQSITLPVCPIISHQERWPAKINWLFHEKQSIWKDDVLSAVRSHLPALWNRIMAGKWSSSQGPRGDMCACV